MKILLNVCCLYKTDTILLSYLEEEIIKYLLIDDYKYYFYILASDHKKINESKYSKQFKTENITGREFSKYYNEGENESFYKIILNSFSLIDNIKNEVINLKINNYEMDLDIVNKFLIDTKLRIGKTFEFKDNSYLNLKTNDKMEDITRKLIERNILYFSIFYNREDSRILIPRWNKPLAATFDYDIMEVTYNDFTNSIKMLSFLDVSNNILKPNIFILNDYLNLDLNENLKSFAEKFTDKNLNKINIEFFNSEKDLIVKFLNSINNLNVDFIAGWESNYNLKYLKERILFLCNNHDDLQTILGLYYKVITKYELNFIKDEKEKHKQEELIKKNFINLSNINYDHESWELNNFPIIRNIIDLSEIWNSKLNNDLDHKKGSNLENVFSVLFDEEIIVPNLLTTKEEKTLKNQILFQLKKDLECMLINDKKMFLTSILDFCGFIPCTIQQIILKGTSFRVEQSILSFIKEKNLFFQSFPNRDKQDWEAGRVIEPETTGLCRSDLFECDYKSFYPSNIFDLNICFTTSPTDEQIKNIDPNDYYTFNIKDTKKHYVKKNIKMGVLPEIAKMFIYLRGAVKEKIKDCKDSTILIYLLNIEKILKLMINATFGVTGSYLFSDIYIAATIAKVGREINLFTCNFISKIRIKNKKLIYPNDDFKNIFNEKKEVVKGKHIRVFYSDTDSLFVEFLKDLSIHEKQNSLLEICQYINDSFKKIFGDDCFLNLEYKSLLPLSFWLQKRHYYYISLKNIENKEDSGLLDNTIFKVESKGSVLVKSNKPKFVKNIVSWMMNKVLDIKNKYRDLNETILNIHEYLKNNINESLQEENIKLSERIINLKFKKTKYKGDVKPQLFKMIDYHKLANQDCYNVPKLNQNVNYVYYLPDKQEKRHLDCVMDPVFLIEKKRKLNIDYYLNQSSLDCIKTDLKMIISLIYKEKYADENELEIGVDGVFENLNKKRKIDNDIFIPNKKKKLECKECIQINQLDIEDIDSCFNTTCPKNLDYNYLK